tara:strand:+ start:368 stop:583 length:216 start_codon:yes stop_codon:yes gene_type:complete
MEDNIQTLFNRLDSNQQKVFVKVLADYYNKKPLSIRNNWFSNYKQIPNQYQEKVLSMLQNKIKLNNITIEL